MAGARAASVPMTLVSDDEADPIRSAITRNEAWTEDSVRHLRAVAERRKKEGPWTVTADRPIGIDLDPHDYYSDAPYYWPDPNNPSGPYVRRDGHANPDRFSANRTALASMCDAVFTLGTAAYLFDDAGYSQHAARIIQAWFLNPKTRMNPNLEHAQAARGVDLGSGVGIIEGRHLIRAIQGIEFLEEAGYWSTRDQAGVRRWFVDYLHWLTTSRNGMEEKESGDDHAAWWTAQVAAVASFVSDQAAEKAAFDYYRDHVFRAQPHPGSGASREESRNPSVSYSAFNLEAYSIICRIAQLQDVDLWNVKSKDGSTIATAIDSLKSYLTSPPKARKEQSVDVSNESLSVLAFAGIGLKKPEYVALYQKLERPQEAWLNLLDLVVERWQAAGHQTRH